MQSAVSPSMMPRGNASNYRQQQTLNQQPGAAATRQQPHAATGQLRNHRGRHAARNHLPTGRVVGRHAPFAPTYSSVVARSISTNSSTAYSGSSSSTNTSSKIFVKNLHHPIDNKAVFETFSVYGNVLNCNIARDVDGNSLGYGFVHFKSEESARAAIGNGDGVLCKNEKLQVMEFIPRREREQEKATNFNNVYVKNLTVGFTEQQLREMFEPYGYITSLKIMVDEAGRSRRFGFVAFQSGEAALAAVHGLHGKRLSDNRFLYVARAQNKSERQQDIRRNLEERQRQMTGQMLHY